MAELNKTDLKEIFKAGAKPTEAQFASLIESQVNTKETTTEAEATGSSVLSVASGMLNLKADQPFIGLVATNSTTGSGISMHAGFGSDFGLGELPNNPFFKLNNGVDFLMDNGNNYTNTKFRIFKNTSLPNISPSTELLSLNDDGGLRITGSLTSSGAISASGNLTVGGAVTAGSITAGSITGTSTTFTNITASGIISASGNITSSNIHIVDEHPKVNLRPNTANGDPQVTFKNSLGEMRGHIRVGITNNTSSFMSIGADTTDPSNPTTSMEKQLYLSASGDVGIGFMDPSEKLMVSGNLKVIDEHPKLFIQSNAASGDPSLQFKSGDGSTMATIRCDVTNNVMNQLSIGSGTNETHLVVDANGNIGVGLLTPGEKLTVTGNVSASGALTAGALTVTGTTTFTSAQVGQRLTKRVLTTTNETLTAAESGKLCLFSDADGATAVLPDSGNGSLVGVYYDFYVAEQLTSGNYNIKCTDTTNEAIIGFLHFCDIDTNPAVSEFTWRALASDSYDQIQMNGTTTGTVGTFFRITNIAPDKWMVNGSLMATGTPATPFVAN